ncbi:hypothetical protein D3C80_774570 [compost metagenome]
MAVTMIKRGQLPAEKWYYGICRKCSSEYRAQEKDLKLYSDFRESFLSAKCQLEGCTASVTFYKERS